MTEEKIKKNFVKIFNSHVSLKLKEEDLEKEWIEFGIDSLSYITLVVELEEFFQVEFYSKEVIQENYKYVQDLFLVILKKIRNIKEDLCL